MSFMFNPCRPCCNTCPLNCNCSNVTELIFNVNGVTDGFCSGCSNSNGIFTLVKDTGNCMWVSNETFDLCAGTTARWGVFQTVLDLKAYQIDEYNTPINNNYLVSTDWNCCSGTFVYNEVFPDNCYNGSGTLIASDGQCVPKCNPFKTLWISTCCSGNNDDSVFNNGYFVYSESDCKWLLHPSATGTSHPYDWTYLTYNRNNNVFTLDGSGYGIALCNQTLPLIFTTDECQPNTDFHYKINDYSWITIGNRNYSNAPNCRCVEPCNNSEALPDTLYIKSYCGNGNCKEFEMNKEGRGILGEPNWGCSWSGAYPVEGAAVNGNQLYWKTMEGYWSLYGQGSAASGFCQFDLGASMPEHFDIVSCEPFLLKSCYIDRRETWIGELVNLPDCTNRGQPCCCWDHGDCSYFPDVLYFSSNFGSIELNREVSGICDGCNWIGSGNILNGSGVGLDDLAYIRFNLGHASGCASLTIGSGNYCGVCEMVGYPLWVNYPTYLGNSTFASCEPLEIDFFNTVTCVSWNIGSTSIME